MLNRKNTIQVEESLKQCLPEFSHVEHYWDTERKSVVAKILPGEFYMTTGSVAIATTLGSCVSACIWDEEKNMGGMNHFMLPLTHLKINEIDWGRRGLASDATRYGNFAMEHLINTILKNGGTKRGLKAKIFGGGKVLKNMSDVGERNIDFVLDYLSSEDIPIVCSNVGLNFPRKVLFQPSSGRAFVKKIDNIHNDTIFRRESDYSNRIKDNALDGDVELF